MRILAGIHTVLLVLLPTAGWTQVMTPQLMEQGTRVRVTFMGDSGLTTARGKFSNFTHQKLVISPEEDTRSLRLIPREMVTQVETGHRDNVIGVVTGLVGLGAGIAIAASELEKSDGSCGSFCSEELEAVGTFSLALIPIILGVGGYVIGHQFDKVVWRPFTLPPVPRE